MGTFSVYFSSTQVGAMKAAIDQLTSDMAANQSASTIRNDIVNYYNAQTAVRGYAAEAAEVAGNTGFNGAVANQNLENYFIGSNDFAGYGPASLGIAESLAVNDWLYIANNNYVVPNLTQDAQEHIYAFQEFGVPIAYWSGTSFAYQDQNWIGGSAQPWELTGPQQSSLFSSLSSEDDLSSAYDLLLAAKDSASVAVSSWSNFNESLQDTGLAMRDAASALSRLGATSLNSLSNWFDAIQGEVSQLGDTLTLSGTTYEIQQDSQQEEDESKTDFGVAVSSDDAPYLWSSDSVTTSSTDVQTDIRDYLDGSSIVAVENPDGSSVSTYYTAADGTGDISQVDQENADDTSSLTTYNSGDTTSTTTNYSGPDGSGAPGSSTTVLKYNAYVNGNPVVYSAGVSYAQSLFVLPAQRTYTFGSASFGTNVQFVAGNLNPNSQNSIEIEVSYLGEANVNLSPSDDSATVNFSTSGLMYETSGQYDNVRLGDLVGYDGNATAHDGLEYDISIYAPAVAKVDFGATDPAPTLYFHVGDAATIGVTVANVASGALCDTLLVGAPEGDSGEIVQSVSGLSDLAAGQSAVLSLGLNTSKDGVFDLTSDDLSLISHDSDLPDIAAQPGGSGSGAGNQVVQVMAYAAPLIAEGQGGANAAFTQTGAGAWTLNFGYQIYDPTGSVGAPQQVIDIQNGTSTSVVGDNLKGTLSATTPGAGFNDSYTLPLSGGNVEIANSIAQGGSIAVAQFSPHLNVLGAQTEIVTFNPVGFNASGYSGSLPAETLTLTDNVVSPDAVPVAMFEVDQAALDALSGGFTIDDAISTLATDLPALEADTHINAIVAAGGVKVTLSGATIAAVNPDGSKTVSTVSTSGSTYISKVAAYSPVDGLVSVKRYNANNQLTAVTYPTQTPTAFTTPTRSDLLFQSASGELATWQVDDTAITGGGGIGDPGGDWTYEGSGDFYGDGHGGMLFRNQDDQLAIWEIAGTQIVGGGDVGDPGGTWNVAGVGDFYGDGYSDILFQDASGDLAVWRMNGTQIVGGVTLGNPGPGWTFLGLGDFNADGQSDLLFENASGQYATWELSSGAVVGGATLGAPGAGWVFKGVGNFNGLGDSDILFQNATTGEYATWDVTDDAISGGGDIGAPGPDWAFAGIEDTTANGHSDILFKNVLTGEYATWDMDDTTIVGGGEVGNPGASYTIASGLPAMARASLDPTLVFDNSAGDLWTWTVGNGAVTAVSHLGNPGANWTELAVGDFWSDGQSDILFENASDDAYALWRTDGTALTGGGVIGANAGYTFLGLGDFDGDGTSDLLFHNAATGDYAIWEMNGTSVLNRVDWGKLPGLTYVATGDFTGAGVSDVLFSDASGNYYAGIVENGVLQTPQEIGAAPGWSFAAVGDLNGDGRADIVFENKTTGEYASWDMDGTRIVGGGFLGDPGPQWTLAGVAPLNSGGHASLIFDNATTGQVVAWEMNDAAFVGGAALGYASGFRIAGAS